MIGRERRVAEAAAAAATAAIPLIVINYDGGVRPMGQ